jgi:hypothetical protein
MYEYMPTPILSGQKLLVTIIEERNITNCFCSV